MFQDAMDSDRVVNPIGQRGNKLDCKVYWRSHGRLNYGGQVTLPASLFSDDPRNNRIGFVRMGDK